MLSFFFLLKVLLDKIKNCRLVVNKLNIIEKNFRNFEMEVLAKDSAEPEANTVVETTEAMLRFKFDFAKVYWNPRLCAERERLCFKLNKQVDVLIDVFAGVGPFAIYAAKYNKCQVLANDLNPDSYHWLCENVNLNKVTEFVRCFNLDGRDFIKTIVKDYLIENVKSYDGSNSNRRYHIVMNLPDIAMNFLDTFDSLLSSLNDSDYEYKIPYLDIHCYCFVKKIPESEVDNYVIQTASEKLGHQISTDDVYEIYYVRKVAPNKIMYRISFKLNTDILYGTKTDYSLHQSKRIKVE